MKFKLNWGEHRFTSKGQTKVFLAGEIIETDVELDKRFYMLRNSVPKFTLVASNTAPVAPVIPTVVRSPSKPVEDVSEQASSTATFTASVAVQEAEDPATWYQENVQKGTATAVAEEDDAPDFARFGEDVTAEFERAPTLNFQVRFDGTRYRVLSENAKVVNGIKKLSTPKDVRIFLKRHAEKS